MSDAVILDLFRDAIFLILTLSMPMLVVAMLVGLLIAIFQATTQIQEQTLAFVPKVVAILLTMLLLGPWLLTKLVEFTEGLLLNINDYIA